MILIFILTFKLFKKTIYAILALYAILLDLTFSIFTK
ncbi:Uncharacterised protein [Clostridioides difficile]|nr:Uncharacterised protein [Clostridioides difficile]